MGCFLGCFGFTNKKQKRIRPCNKFQVHQKYVPLDSEKEIIVDSANSVPRDKPKESSKRKVKKKVSFNLDVKTYERIQDDENNTTYFSEEEEEKTNKQETAKASMSMYPSSHRYYNCNNSYDEEEDEITLEDSDIDDLDDEEEEEDYGVSDEYDDDDVGGDECANSLHIETENKYGHVEKLNKDESNEVGRNHRSSVLLPVENLTQWKAVKAKGAQQVKHQKENIIKLDGKQEFPLIAKPVNNHCVGSKAEPQGHDIPVDASLSNWMVSARTTSVNGSAVYYNQDRAVDQVVLDEVNII
ncbi:hypothetical protein KY284_037077 [Solanum tuberosum]|nr:hypothetical protein KY284_037077 [Solanum tuberosum]